MKTSAYGKRDYAFGRAMLTLRTKIGLTQVELANELGLSRRSVGEWEAGSSYPKAQRLKALIALAVKRQAFPAGQEAQEIRDGTRLASGSSGEGSGELFMWDVQSGVRLRAFAGHSGQVHGVVWSPDGDQLISGDTDGKLRWWDVETAECVRTLDAHEEAIRSLRVSPDGRWLASCGDDGAIKIWDLTRNAHVRTLRRARPYERLNIRGVRGLNEAQKTSLLALGAIDEAESSL
jgi:transcriptional regulator with XRE-family HTH domain